MLLLLVWAGLLSFLLLTRLVEWKTGFIFAPSIHAKSPHVFMVDCSRKSGRAALGMSLSAAGLLLDKWASHAMMNIHHYSNFLEILAMATLSIGHQ
jgi:hypothetical protein